MTFNEYQNFCQSTRIESANDRYTILNLSGEVGELHSIMAKAIRDGRKPDYEQNVKKELGDIMWSVATIALDNGFTLEDVVLGNYYKLKDRAVRGALQGSGDDR